MKASTPAFQDQLPIFELGLGQLVHARHYVSAEPNPCSQVYNTGRALDKWEQLIGEKRGVLAPPDVLILSVGTKVQPLVTSRGGMVVA